MTDIEKIKSAKEWILRLANGVNPLNNTPLNGTDIVNDVHISRCLFYVAEVLNSSIKTRAPRQARQYDLDFYLSEENAARVLLVEHTGIANFIREINKVIPSNMHPVTIPQVSKWLVDEGFLTEVASPEGKKNKQATTKGNAQGIVSDWQRRTDGNTYLATSYNLEAQKFILAHINLIVK
ncbi:MAG: hypothetical protein MJZ75_01000 [Paludibacteraceae bacterium]|nr:hypothetical protein [Paludibacteraceae bacterium]